MIAGAASHGAHPHVLARIQVDGGDASVGRLDHRQAVHDGGTVGEPAGVRVRRVLLFRLIHRHDGRQAVGRHVQHARFRVHGRARPTRAAHQPWHGDHAFLGRRRKERTVVVLGDRVHGRLAQLGREIDEIGFRQALALEGRRLRGEGLRGRGGFAGHRGRRGLPLLDRPDRLSCRPVEDIGESLLRDLDQRLDLAAVHHEVHQVRRGGQVIVPDAVMHHLEMPDPFARLGVQTDQAFGEEIVAEPMAAVEVVGGCADRQIDVSQRFVRAHPGPYVRAARGLPGLVLPGLVPELSFLGYGLEHPFLFPVSHVEPAHVAWRHGRVRHPEYGKGVQHRRPDHDYPADDCRRAGNGVEAAVDGTAQALRQVHAPVLAEIRNRFARSGVQRDEIGVARGIEDSPVVPLLPVGHAAMDEPDIGGRPVLPRPGIV